MRAALARHAQSAEPGHAQWQGLLSSSLLGGRRCGFQYSVPFEYFSGLHSGGELGPRNECDPFSAQLAYVCDMEEEALGYVWLAQVRGAHTKNTWRQ